MLWHACIARCSFWISQKLSASLQSQVAAGGWDYPTEIGHLHLLAWLPQPHPSTVVFYFHHCPFHCLITPPQRQSSLCPWQWCPQLLEEVGNACTFVPWAYLGSYTDSLTSSSMHSAPFGNMSVPSILIVLWLFLSSSSIPWALFLNPMSIDHVSHLDLRELLVRDYRNVREFSPCLEQNFWGYVALAIVPNELWCSGLVLGICSIFVDVIVSIVTEQYLLDTQFSPVSYLSLSYPNFRWVQHALFGLSDPRVFDH